MQKDKQTKQKSDYVISVICDGDKNLNFYMFLNVILLCYDVSYSFRFLYFCLL